MPIVRPYPIGEVSPQPIPNVAPSVPAASDLALFGGNRARDLQVAGQNLGQASDTLFALYQREAQAANDTRVQDLNNQFLDGSRAVLQTGPDAYYNLSGADAVKGADAATAKLTSLRDQVFGQTANDYQRQRLAPILDAHLAASTAGIVRHVAGQQAVYNRGVAANAIETSRAEAMADPAMMDNAVFRAEGAARMLHAGQPPEAVETGVRAAGSSVITGVIGDRLARNDPMGIRLYRQYGDRLDPSARQMLGAAAETLSNTLDAAAWLRDRSATLPVGDASASTAEPALPDQDGIVGAHERLDAIEQRRGALTALNQQEFIANPARLRANQTAIDTDTARSRAAVKADMDGLYADLRRHLTMGGPNGGPAVTPPPATIMSRLTDAQQDAVTAQINANIEGRKPNTDPQTWYAIRQGLTAADATERQRWASKNLVQFMGRLSADDFAALEKLQAAVRSNDGGAEQSRLQIITRMANEALRSVGIDPTPRPDAPPDSDAMQAARFHRALQDELSAVESRGGKPTEAEAYDIVNGLKDTGIKSGWLQVRDGRASPTVLPDLASTDDALPFTADEIAGMRRTLAEGTAEQRAAVFAQYAALPDDMKAAVAEKLVPQGLEPTLMSDSADERPQEGQQYAQAAPTRGSGRGGGLRPLTPRQQMELMEYQSKVDVIRRLEPENCLAGPRITTEDSPVSRQQMEEINRELVEVQARAAQRDLEREERERGETPSESLPSADDLVRSTVPGGFLSRSPSEVPDRAEQGNSSGTPRSIVQTLQERELTKFRTRHNLNGDTPTNRRILENLDKPFEEFTGLAKNASVWNVLPTDMRSWTVRRVLESKNRQARKLLMQERSDK